MDSDNRRIRAPVKRRNAQFYLLLTVVSFAGSVVLTRLYLGLTGFPQLGSGDFHIAHVLWGGLLLFIAAILPLIWANRWVFSISAILNGMGVGLFIDEVGKFITQNNNYFSPLAAPIIYALFLITVLVYLQVRRPPRQDPRGELYRAFDMLEEMLDHDLDPRERAELEVRLRQVAEQAEHPDLARLATVLSELVASETLYLVPGRLAPWEQWIARAKAFEERWIGPRRLKTFLIAGFGVFGLVGLIEPILVLFIMAFSPGQLEQVASSWVMVGQVRSATSLQWFLIGLALQGLVGLILTSASMLLLTGAERRGLQLGYFGLLMSLTSVNLLTFYFAQFGNLVLALVQLMLLLALLRYRRRYLNLPAIEQVSRTLQLS
jgi:hypothetical protein